MKFAVLVGSVRSDRQGIKAARFVQRALMARGHDVSLVDPRHQVRLMCHGDASSNEARSAISE